MRSTVIFLAVFFMIGVLPLSAAPSPWDSWRSGYTNFEQGESFRERGNYTESLKYFEKARKNYIAVRTARPDWNQRVIADRLRDCDRQIAELRRLLGESAKKPAAPEKKEEVKVPATPVADSSGMSYSGAKFLTCAVNPSLLSANA